MYCEPLLVSSRTQFYQEWLARKKEKAMPNVSFSGLLIVAIVAASQIGLELGLITKATGAALIAAGLLSVLIFPLLALTILRRTREVSTPAPK